MAASANTFSLWNTSSFYQATTGPYKACIADNFQNCPVVQTPGSYGNIASLAISPDGKTVVTGSVDKTVRLWNISGKTPVLIGVMQLVSCNHGLVGPIPSALLRMCPWISHYRSQPVMLWNSHYDQVTSVAFSPDGELGHRLFVMPVLICFQMMFLTYACIALAWSL